MKKHLLLIVIASLVITPFISHADVLVIQTSNQVVGNTFVVQYKAQQPPTVAKKVHLWVGEYDKTPATWITQSQVIQNLTTGTTGYPKTFSAQMDFAALGIKPGVKYSYTITDKGAGSLDDAFVYDMNNGEELAVKCFTTTGAVPCKTGTPNPSGNQALDASSFTLTPEAQAIDTEHQGKFLTSFSIAPKVALTAPLTVTLKIYSEATGSPVWYKEGTFPIPAGSGTTFPTVEDLAPGNYRAILYAGTTQVSGEVGWAVGAVGPGGAKATFNYVGLPSVTCEKEISICEFKITTNVTSPGTLKFSLYGYPKTIYDGKPKVNGAEMVYGDYESVVIGQHITSLEMSFADISAFTHATNDSEFWFKFYEKQNDLNSDVGNVFSSTTEGVSFTPNTDPTVGGDGFHFGGNGSNDTTGICGSAGGSSTPALTSSSANLCSKGTVSEFNYDGFNYSWKCKGTDGTTRSCIATGGTDTNYGDGFLKNPLAPGLDTFPKIIAAVYNNIILPIAIPFIVIAIMYAGFKFVIARKEGRVDGYADAKRILKYTLIGAGLLLGGWVIANALQGTLNSLLGPESAKPATTSLIFNKPLV